MKKFTYVLMPLMVIPFLASCNKGYQITLDAHGGAFSDGKTTKVVNVAPNEKLQIPENPTKKVYSVMSWYTDENLTTQYDFSKPVTANFTLYARYKETLDDFSWKEISDISKLGKADKYFKVGDTKKVQLNHQDLNVNHQIDEGEVYQTVRIIDFNHDPLSDGSGNAGITFEFADLISDAKGFSLATFWDFSKKNSQDFINSELRQSLDGGGTASSFYWFEKSSGGASETYNNIPVIGMLPEDLQSNLKEVTKPIAEWKTSAFELTDYDTKMFILSCREVIKGDITKALEEGSTYAYYTEPEVASDVIVKNRIKRQINWDTDDANIGAYPLDNPFSGTTSYAGFEDPKDNCGSNLWLRSPLNSDGLFAMYINENGSTWQERLPTNAAARPVAPAFCI